MEVRLLGPVEVRAAGRAVDAGSPRQRCVLAALAADAGRPVSTETLIDRVWGHAPPGQVRQTLYVYITHPQHDQSGCARRCCTAACGAGQPAG